MGPRWVLNTVRDLKFGLAGAESLPPWLSRGALCATQAIQLEAGLKAEARGLLFENWPIQAAVDSYQTKFAELRHRQPQSVEFVRP